MKANKGDVVLVDSRVLTASPVRGKGTVECTVLIDSGDSQTYVVPRHNTPMYVFNRDILSKVEADEKEN